MKKNKKFKQKRSAWFKIIKSLLFPIYKKPNVVYLGERVEGGSIILSNHEGARVPLTLELHMDSPIRFWGTYEMNSDIVTLYKYLSGIYFHQKRHWNLTLARIFSFFAAPFVFLFYRGLGLISTFPDARLATTIKKSINVIEDGESIVIFPEDSSKGYFKELTHFFPGFVMLAERLYNKKGIDVPIFVSYFRKTDRKYIFDAPVYYSELSRGGKTREEIANTLLIRCNELGSVTHEKSFK